MATKDWVIEETEGNYIKYYHKNYPSTTISIGRYKRARGESWSGKWYVQVSDPNPRKILNPQTKLFSTESSAKNYAKILMRKQIK